MEMELIFYENIRIEDLKKNSYLREISMRKEILLFKTSVIRKILITFFCNGDVDLRMVTCLIKESKKCEEIFFFIQT